MPFLASSENNRGNKLKKDFKTLSVIENKDFKELKFQLSNSLQSSLQIKDVLGNFHQTIKKIVPVSSVEYSMTDKNMNVQFGQSKSHQACYQLKYQKHHFGQIRFTRSKRFTEEELSKVEELIAVLILPLKNALLYHEALQNSLRDTLTGIGNRAAFELTLKREMNLAARERKQLSLLVIDIDYFKKINDDHGHHKGDEALKFAAALIAQSLRQTDQVFRYGGEEFCVILSGTGIKDGLQVAERIRSAMAKTLCKAIQSNMTVSIGAASLCAQDDRDSLFERADAALYEAKQSGRNAVMKENTAKKINADIHS